MGKKKDAKTDDDAEKKGGKSKIIIIVVALGLGAGGYILGGKSSATPAAGVVTTTTLLQKKGCKGMSVDDRPKTVVDLPSMSINLADNHYLRVTVSLGLCDDVIVAKDEVFPSAPAKDIIVASLSGKKMEDLATESGREAAKQTLVDGITEAYKGEVYTVFLAEFVMQ
jgi:flagellar basal body-associated protein FliL